jgi:hypothetical protein
MNPQVGMSRDPAMDFIRFFFERFGRDHFFKIGPMSAQFFPRFLRFLAFGSKPLNCLLHRNLAPRANVKYFQYNFPLEFARILTYVYIMISL